MKGKGLHMAAFILLIVGGLNWLLVGLFGWDVGEIFGGQDAVISRLVYVLVGLAAIYELASHKKACCMCNSNCTCAPSKPKPDMPAANQASDSAEGDQAM